MKSSKPVNRIVAMLLAAFFILGAPLTALAKKGDKNFKQGLQYEAAQKWEEAAQEFALAVAADPSNISYQLHYRRALFNASQAMMIKGRSLAEQRDYTGAYNAFRQAYGYDPSNQLALSEMDRMLRLQTVKEGSSAAPTSGANNAAEGTPETTAALQGGGTGGTPPSARGETGAGRSSTAPSEQPLVTPRPQQLRVVTYNNVDLKSAIRSLADELNLNVVFDKQSFAQPRTLDISLRDVTTAQALDYIFLQESLFFQKLDRHTILVANQQERGRYQQLVLKTFYLANAKPEDARTLLAGAIPAQPGRGPATVIIDKDTNSLTIRDTPENIRLYGELLQSIDKDRAEVVMDVAIYEVSNSDLLQLGNQFGTETQLANIGLLQGGIATRPAIGANLPLPTSVGAAFALPPSTLVALQRKDRTKLIASTQIHAFNGEESTARIGQRVPVQTAQVTPFGYSGTATTTPGTGATSGLFGGTGYPVINYEPVGLTLKFTPQVFPNLDVQVKMSIESKDVLNATLTPTFTERTITGTARIQNNRAMLLASVSQDKQSNGREGLPLVGLVPVLGRLFTAPRRDNSQTDIVIAVTPRVLRAPAVTPRDEESRPSGTISTPTTPSLEAMLKDTEREDQLAAARRLPTNAVVQLPNAEAIPAYMPAPAAFLNNAGRAAAPTSSNGPSTGNAAAAPTASPSQDQRTGLIVPAVQTGGVTPAPRTAVDVKPTADSGAATPAARGAATGITPARDTALAEPKRVFVEERREEGARAGQAPASAAELRLVPVETEMRVGERRRIAVVLKTDAPLGLAVVTLRFDPRNIAVRGIANGNLLTGTGTEQPRLMPSIDPKGVLLVSVTPPDGGKTAMTGAGVLFFIEIEALSPGASVIQYDRENVHVVASDGRGLILQLAASHVTVKP